MRVPILTARQCGSTSRFPARRNARGFVRSIHRRGICSTRCGSGLPNAGGRADPTSRSEEHTSELQSHLNLVCRLLLEKKKKCTRYDHIQSPKIAPTNF